MTQGEFLSRFAAQVKKTKALWRLVGPMLRLGGLAGHCPLSWVANTSPGSIVESAERMGLRIQTARRISNAADSNYSRFPVLRAALLKAAGIQRGV